jgi:hypothetical protein
LYGFLDGLSIRGAGGLIRALGGGKSCAMVRLDFSDQEAVDDYSLRHLVFISHTAVDFDFIEREIVPVIQGRQLDIHFVNRSKPSPRISALYRRFIRRSLNRCWWFVVVLSSASVLSEWVKYEVSQAFEIKARGQIVPVIINDCDPSLLDERLCLNPIIDCRKDLLAAKHELENVLSKAE